MTTDRTPASPVEVLTVEQALREAIDYARLSPNGERRKRWEAALQAQDHTITKGGLDVERLARALEPAFGPSFFPGMTDVTVFGKTPLEVAEAIAVEYDRAALEPTHD